MSSKLNFEFVSPMASIFSGEVDSVLIPAKEGDAEILPQHAPFMTALRVGVVEIKIANSENLKFLIDGGFADIEKPIHVSNIAVVSPQTGKATRVRIEEKDGKKVRVATACGSTLS